MDLAEQALCGCMKIAVKVGDDFLLARAQNTFGIILGDMRRYGEAESYFVSAIDNLERIGRIADFGRCDRSSV